MVTLLLGQNKEQKNSGKAYKNSEFTVRIDFYILNNKIIVAESQHGRRVRALET